MCKKNIHGELVLSILELKHAQELFALTDKNRNYLRKWLPWVDYTVHENDTAKFINEQSRLCLKRQAFHAAIEFEAKIVGVVGYDELDSENNTGSIGYWLGEQFNGFGLMTMAVKKMIITGFDDYELNRVEIQCATENYKSRAIPERLGFTQEGILRNAEKVNEEYLDLAVYGLLKSESRL